MKAVLTRFLFLNDAPGRDTEQLAAEREIRRVGKDWPEEAETMIGMARLDNLQECAEVLLSDGVPGDLLEAGVWRGGATIFMRAVLAAYGVTDRKVWVADSFEGLPAPNPDAFPIDAATDLSVYDVLAVSLEQVKANFARYGLLDEQVRFLQGWFKDTLPDAPVQQLALLRLDGDYYESTIQILESLYHKLAPGGFVIVDDYGALVQCSRAVDDFRAEHNIKEAMSKVDWTGVYWRVGG